MSKRAFDKIRAGLDSARSYLGGKGAYRSPPKSSLDEMGPGPESRPAARSTMGRPGQHGAFKANKKRR